MIETAKDTLEYCWIERLNDFPHHIAESVRPVRPEKIVSFPSLKFFSANFDDGLAQRIGDQLDILEYSMDCPTLEDLNLSVMTPDSMLRDLITESITTLSVGIREENQTGLTELLEGCNRLETLTFWHQPNSGWIYDYLHENTWQTQLKELRVILPTDDLFEALLKYVVIRSSDIDSNNLETLSFLHQQPFTTSTVDWISQFVGQVKTYGQPPTPEFTKILNKHNGYLSFEDDERDALI